MSRCSTLLLFMAIGVEAIGQPLLPLDPRVDLNTGYRNRLSMEGTFDFNANSILNELPLALYQGGYLDRNLRERSAGKLRSKGNTAGYIIEGSMQWTGAACWSAKPTWRPTVKIGLHDLAGLSFTEDQFNITFFGNADHEGRTAELAPSAYEQVRFQSISAGIIDDSSGSYIRAGLLRGAAFAYLSAERATLHTGEDGRVLHGVIHGEYAASDTAADRSFRTDGLGAAVSACWAFQTSGKRPIRIRVGVEDLGFIAWNKNAVRISKDTLFRYEGWHVDNLFALDDVIVNEQTLIDTLGLHHVRGSQLRLAPFHLRGQASMNIDADWQTGLCVEHRYITGYRPQVTALATRVIGARTMIGGTIGYGGFGSARLGISAKRRFGDHVLVSLSTPQLAGFVTQRTRGLGLMVACLVGF